MRRRLARRLRYLADRISPDTGPRAIGVYFTIEPGIGRVMHDGGSIQLNPPVPGCPLWYMAEDYDRAFGRRVEPRNLTKTGSALL